MFKDYIVVIKDYVEDMESGITHDRLIRVLHCKNCLSETDALVKARQLLIGEGRFTDAIIDIMFDDPAELFFQVKVFSLNDNSSILYSI